MAHFSQWHQPCSLTISRRTNQPRIGDDLGPTCRAIFGSANVFVGTLAMQTVAVMKSVEWWSKSGVRSMEIRHLKKTGAPSPLHENDCQAKFLGRKFRRKAKKTPFIADNIISLLKCCNSHSTVCCGKNVCNYINIVC